jgi:hypothetical protein
MFSILKSNHFFWYIFCMTILCILPNGCYYWRPLEVIAPNTPPEILHSDPPMGAVMQLSPSSSNIAFVVAQDETSNDSLRFQWYISGAAFLGAGESLPQEGFIGSKIEFTSLESSWHNRNLNCVVYDSYNASASISWPIEILEGN